MPYAAKNVDELQESIQQTHSNLSSDIIAEGNMIRVCRSGLFILIQAIRCVLNSLLAQIHSEIWPAFLQAGIHDRIFSVSYLQEQFDQLGNNVLQVVEVEREELIDFALISLQAMESFQRIISSNGNADNKLQLEFLESACCGFDRLKHKIETMTLTSPINR